MELIENLKWRYATKKFDYGKKISAEDLEKLQEAIQLAVVILRTSTIQGAHNFRRETEGEA